MKTFLRVGRLGSALTSLALCVAVGLFAAGCSDTAKKPADKKADKTADTKKTDTPKDAPKETPKKPDEPAKPVAPVKPAEPDVPLPPGSLDGPAMPKVDEPVKPVEPPKPAEPKVDEPVKPTEPTVKPEEPAKPEEPKKPEEPAKPAEPKVEEPAKPAEPPVKPEEPKKPEEPAKPAEPKVEEPAKPAEPTTKMEEPVKPTELAAKSEEPKAPVAAAGDVKVSTFAPAEDLVNEVDAYIERLNEAVATEAEYKDNEGIIEKDANTLCVVALALGLHDQDSKYEKNAPALLKASQDLAAAKGFEAAKKAVEAVAKAAEQGGDGPALKWEKVASLPQLMKAVPVINTKLKRNTDARRFKSKAKDTAGYSAVIAAIGQASLADLSETKDPDEVAKWQKYCIEMRNEAGALNAAIRGADEAAAKEVMPKLAKSCDDCHETFHKEALGKTDVEEK